VVKNTYQSDLGKVRVSDEAIAEIAALASQKVAGVAGMGSGSGVESLAEMLGLRSGSQGVAVEMGASQVSLRLFLIVEFGAEIGELSLAVQDAAAEAVEKMTGLEVKAVDVTIQGVRFASHDKKARP
jgi:uncharacterized alkaline shock family protein YloU